MMVQALFQAPGQRHQVAASAGGQAPWLALRAVVVCSASALYGSQCLASLSRPPLLLSLPSLCSVPCSSCCRQPPSLSFLRFNVSFFFFDRRAYPSS